MSKIIDRDRAFYEWWKEEYSLFRPDEPDETKGEEESAWKKLQLHGINRSNK